MLGIIRFLRRHNLMIISGALLIGALAAFLVALFAVEVDVELGENDPETISFAIYGDERTQRIVQDVAETFMRNNNCVVEVYCYPSEASLNTKVLEQAAAGKAFEVFYVNREALRLLKRGGWVCDLQSIVSSRRSNGDEYYGSTLACGKSGGVQCAMPTGVMPYVLYYDRNVFEGTGLESPQALFEAGRWNFDTFCLLAGKVYGRTKQPAIYLDSGWPTVCTWLLCDGGSFMPGTNANIDYKAQATVKRLQELVGSGVAAYDEEPDGNQAKAAFIKGETAFMLGDLSLTREMTGGGAGWDVIPLPSVNSDFSSCSFDVPMIAVSEGGKSALAMKFVDFYVSSFGQKLRLEKGECLIPSLNTVFYTSMGNNNFPDHSNYYFFAIESGRLIYESTLTAANYEQIMALWQRKMSGAGGIL